MGWPYGTHGRKERCMQSLVEGPEGKRPLGGPRHKVKDNIKMFLKEVGLGGMDWIDLNQDGDRLCGGL